MKNNIYLFLLILTLLCIDVPKSKGQGGLEKDGVVVTNIIISGNRKTKEHIIKRELSFIAGDTLSKIGLTEFLEKEKNKVFNTSLFVTVNIWAQSPDADTTAINIEVIEQWYIFVIPMIDVADRNFNEWLQNQNGDLSRLEYGVSLNWKNFRGRREVLKSDLQFGFTKKIKFEYQVPYLNKLRTLGAKFSVSYSENKDVNYASIEHKQDFYSSNRIIYNRFNAKVSFDYRKNFYITHTFGAAGYNNAVDDTVVILNPDFYLFSRRKQSYLSLHYTYNQDFRNIQYYPTSGYQFLLTVEKKGLGILGDGLVNAVDVFSSYSKFLVIKEDRFFWETSMRGKISFPNIQPYPNFRGMGYGNYIVRGLDLYVIEAQHLAIIQNSLRFKVFDKVTKLGKVMPISQFNTIPVQVFLRAFIDAGYFHNDFTPFGNEFLINRPTYGYGLGVDVVTFYNVVVKTEFSLNHRGESGLYLYVNSDF